MRWIGNILYGLLYPVLLLARLCSILGLGRIAHPLLYIALTKVLKYRNRIIERNLLVILPDASDRERARIKNDYYHHLCDLVFEAILSFTAHKEELQNRIVIQNESEVKAIMLSKRSKTILLTHIGNWELFCQWGALYAEDQYQTVILYTSFKGSILNQLMIRLRQRTGAILVSTKEMRKFFRLQKGPKPVINFFAIDQNPGDPFHQEWLSFFNLNIPVLSGPEKFLKGRNQDVYFLWVEKEKSSGRYILSLHPIVYEKNVDLDLTRKQLRLLEDNVKKDPSIWLLSHNRFKYSRAENKFESVKDNSLDI